MRKLPEKEDIQTEFKPNFNTEVVETLVAFANAKGGTVFVGVHDKKGTPLGITIGKESVANWINDIKSITSPQIVPDVEVFSIDGKDIAAFSIAEYPVKPVSTRGKHFKRFGNSNHLLNSQEIANEHLKTINSSWDFYIAPNHSEKDLSDEKIKKFANVMRQNESIGQLEMSDTQILEKMEIFRGNKITFGAYLLFAKDYCSISDVQIGRFKSDTMIIDSLSLNCDLFQEVEAIIVFIKKHLKVEYIITGNPQRTERLDYPLDAIREIVINMIVHRDYRDSSASIIKIFDNRIEFFNPGNLYDGITIENLLSGNYTSKSRNKLIAKTFKEIGMIERYGSGIMRVRKICREYGVKEPDFYEMTGGFQVVLYNEVVDYGSENDTVNAENDTVNAENDTVNAENDTVNAGNDTVSLKKKQQLILDSIAVNPYITSEKLAEIVGITAINVRVNLAKLKEKGLLERIGADKNGYWKIINKGDPK
ncbi:MAG: putative DNA binding domain-containing protein [Chitinivibrionia bacterium]|nr:putative DNA binding domain-containing protein [Chitinivibrionia bacterium]